MGTSTQPVEVQDALQQPDHMHSGSAAVSALSGKAAAAAGQHQHQHQQQQQQSALYWYGRAHRAIKQRASEPLQLMREYQHICALDYSITHSCSIAKSRAAAGRNRYTNVLPFDYNRVTFQQHKAPYINASLVSVHAPLLQQPCRYIATQGPLPATSADFWAMVMELRVPAVVMLTNVAEAGLVKCSQYFPHTLHSVSRVGSYEIKVEQQVPLGPDCTLRTLALTCDDTHTTHTLSHYHFHSWPDHGTPESSSCIRAMCRALQPAHSTGHPILVHCSAGIGRTGTFCAIDILLQRLDAWSTCHNGQGPERSEVEDTLDLPQLVHELRTQRMGMVQTIEQYVFVYKALLDDLATRIKDSNSSSNNNSSSSNSSIASGADSASGVVNATGPSAAAARGGD